MSIVDCEKSQERGAKNRASSWQLSLSFPALAHEWFLYIYSNGTRDRNVQIFITVEDGWIIVLHLKRYLSFILLPYLLD